MSSEMPRQVTPTVKVQGLPGGELRTRPAAEDFGGQAAQALTVAGGKVGDVAHTQRLINADFDAGKADLDYAEKESEAWAKFRATYKGKDADDPVIKQKFQDELRQLREDTATRNGLTDPLARKRYEAMTRRRADNRMSQVSQYAYEQKEKYQEGTMLGYAHESVREARENPYNLDKIGEGIKNVTHFTGAFFAGKEPDTLTNKRIQGQHVAIIEGALNGFMGLKDYNAAKAFLDKPIPGLNGESGAPITPRMILGAKAKHWESTLKEGKANTEGDALAFSTYQASGWNATRTRDVLVGKLNRGEIDQDTYSAAEKALTHHVNARADYVDKDLAVDVSAAWNIYNNKGLPALMASGELWSRLSKTQWAHYFKVLDQKDDKAERNPEAMLGWNAWFYNESPDKLLKMTPEQFTKKMLELGLSKDQMEVASHDVKVLQAQKNPMRTQQQSSVMKTAMYEFAVKLGHEWDISNPEQSMAHRENWPEEDRAAFNYALGQIRILYDNWAKTHTRGELGPDFKEYNSWIKDLTDNIHKPPGVSRSWKEWAKENLLSIPATEPAMVGRAREAVKTDRAEAVKGAVRMPKPGEEIPEMTDEQRAAIIRDLKEMGGDISPENVQATYEALVRAKAEIK